MHFEFFLAQQNVQTDKHAKCISTLCITPITAVLKLNTSYLFECDTDSSSPGFQFECVCLHLRTRACSE